MPYRRQPHPAGLPASAWVPAQARHSHDVYAPAGGFRWATAGLPRPRSYWPAGRAECSTAAARSQPPKHPSRSAARPAARRDACRNWGFGPGPCGRWRRRTNAHRGRRRNGGPRGLRRTESRPKCHGGWRRRTGIGRWLDGRGRRDRGSGSRRRNRNRRRSFGAPGRLHHRSRLEQISESAKLGDRSGETDQDEAPAQRSGTRHNQRAPEAELIDRNTKSQGGQARPVTTIPKINKIADIRLYRPPTDAPTQQPSRSSCYG